MFCGGAKTIMIQKRTFGKMPSGEEIEEYTLANVAGLTAKVITYGGILTELHVPDRHGQMADVVLGFDNLQQYLDGHPYFGCITGRVAGRLTGAQFSLENKTYPLAVNDPPNHLHGGKVGLDKRIWQATAGEQNGRSWLRLFYLSPDGEEGYPGNVRMAVTYSVTPANELVIDYEATTDRATPLNLTHHAYFNLAGAAGGRIDNHVLQILADDYAPTNETMTLLGQRKPVASGANDFTKPRRVGDTLSGLWKNHGDLYFLRAQAQPGAAAVVRLSDPWSGRAMSITTTEPCVQFYTGMGLDGTLTGKTGVKYGKHAALCLECHGYPNGVNEPKLGNIVLKPGETYRQRTVHKFESA
jgi:aldose 1-epimerase